MPIYEYECQNCGRRTEALQKLNDPPLASCEICGGDLKKLISSPAFQFKGSGWYVTDYARKGAEGSSGSKEEGGKEPQESKGAKEKEPAKTAASSEGTGSSGGSSGGDT